jgi:hypothetical protein
MKGLKNCRTEPIDLYDIKSTLFKKQALTARSFFLPEVSMYFLNALDFLKARGIPRAFNPLTYGLFEVRYLTACGLNCPQICGRICPQL